MSNAGRSWSRFGKFNLVGLLGAALQMVLLWLLIKRFQVSALAATPVAVEIVVLHNLAWHERRTWRDRPAKNLRQRMVRFWRFHAANGLTSLVIRMSGASLAQHQTRGRASIRFLHDLDGPRAGALRLLRSDLARVGRGVGAAMGCNFCF